ncbi:MAG: hydrogenase maturation nickel metallochaperone HypA [Bacteroidota bacterium]
MHEVSLVRSIVNTLEDQFSSEELDRLTEVRMQIGLLSNVEPVLLQNALEAVQQGEQKLVGVKLSVELLPVLVECELCGSESRIENYHFKCSHCGRPTNNIIQGTELLIHQVEFAEAATVN